MHFYHVTKVFECLYTIRKRMQMHPVYSHLRFCTFNITHVHLASHRIFEHFLALVGQVGHLRDMKGEKVINLIKKIVIASSVSYLMSS